MQGWHRQDAVPQHLASQLTIFFVNEVHEIYENIQWKYTY